MFRTAFALCLLASPALADEFVQFHSPSGNIHCAISTGEWNNARCDIFEYSPSFRSQPNWCEFDWGGSFSVDLDSRKGEVACVSDTVANEDGLELGYGKTLSLGGFSCTSEKTGMTCTNPAGHGFTIAKAKQKIY